MTTNKSAIVKQRFIDLASGFTRYLDAYDGRGPFSSEQMRLHVRTIAIRKELGSARAAAHSREFVATLYATLRAWRIGVRASKLASVERLGEMLREHAQAFSILEGETIDHPDLPVNEVTDQIWTVIASMPIVENQAKLVAATKTLHHLLPDLVPPMDRAWTGRFLGVYPAEWQVLDKQRRVWTMTFRGLAEVARAVQPQRFVGANWRSSRTKVLDNALIGYCMQELPQPSAPEPHQPARRDHNPSPGTYLPLHDWLSRQTSSPAPTTFASIEVLLKRALPPSARKHRAWWGNHAGNPQAQAWLAAGWRVETVNLPAESVTFVR